MRIDNMATKEIPVYVASPLGFTAEGRSYLRTELYPALEKIGFKVLDPWAYQKTMSEAAIMESAKKGLPEEVAVMIGETNVKLINEAKLVVAVLNGPDVDSGTAEEIGDASRAGKSIFGLRTDIRPGEIRGVNIQIFTPIKQSGGEIFNTKEELLLALANYKEKLRV
jgi:nucleoside 2-deoxyribosyltransferase